MNPLEQQTGSYHYSPEGLKLISRCPLCSENYRPFQASIVEEKEDAQLLHIQCHKCHCNMVALIVSGHVGLSSVGLITDLTSTDVERFKDATAITREQVLDAYRFFQRDANLIYKQLTE